MRQIAVVTGAASGIGLATAERLLDDGWPVAFLDADAEALAGAEQRFAGADAVFLTADVTDEDEIAEAMDQAVDALGPVGGLVTSAGIARDLPLEQTSAELFRQVLDINLIGSFIAVKAALERMGDTLAIVTISSVSGLRANDGRVAYGTSKAAVKMMTEIMALELGPRGIRVNSVAPGPIETPMVTKLHGDAARGKWRERVPMRRYGEPSEIAAAVAFLLSQEAGYINGHTLVVDGGFTPAGIFGER